MNDDERDEYQARIYREFLRDKDYRMAASDMACIRNRSRTRTTYIGYDDTLKAVVVAPGYAHPQERELGFMALRLLSLGIFPVACGRHGKNLVLLAVCDPDHWENDREWILAAYSAAEKEAGSQPTDAAALANKGRRKGRSAWSRILDKED